MVDLRLNINNIFETTVIMCLPRYVTEFEFHGLVFSVKIGLVYYFYLASAVWSLFMYCCP